MKHSFPHLTFLALLSLLFLLPPAFPHSNPSHTCIHDEIDYHHEFLDIPINNSTNQRMLLASQNIRIHLDFSMIANSTDEFKNYIMDVITPPAKNYFEAALKVNPLTGNLTLKGMTSACGNTVTIPSQYITQGVAADLLVFVATTKDATNTFLATAGSCMLHSGTLRPIVGKLTYNIASIVPTTNKAGIEKDIGVTLHEITHLLGFSASLFSYYIDPLTNKFLSNTIITKTVNGRQMNILTVEPLRTRLRNHFNCPTLEGAYIENQGRIGSMGSHFEKRVFYNEYMTASTVLDYRITEFTLALLEGSGWYQVNYNLAEPITWGKGKGCEFLETPCINPETQLPISKEFCSSLTKMGCSWTRRGVASCGASKIRTDDSLPDYWNYWGNKTIVTDQFADNCPIYNIYPILDCENEANLVQSTLPSQEFYGEGGKCFLGTLAPKGIIMKNYGYCFKASCELQAGGSYYVKVKVGIQEVTCSTQGDISIEGLDGKLTCPDPVRFCNQYINEGYCERKCMGRGTCIDKKCECQDGWGHNDCSRKTYASHCSKCQNGDPYKTSCYGDTCACNPCNSTCATYWIKLGQMKESDCVATDYLSNTGTQGANTDRAIQEVIDIRDYKIIIGLAVSGLTIVGLALFFLYRYMRKRAKKQSKGPTENRRDSKKISLKDLPAIVANITNPDHKKNKTNPSKYEILGGDEEKKVENHVIIDPKARRESKKLTLNHLPVYSNSELAKQIKTNPSRYEVMEEDHQQDPHKVIEHKVRHGSRKSTLKDVAIGSHLDLQKYNKSIPTQFEVIHEDDVKENEV